ncbi:DUF6907 domain-containing protein [Streptomyces hydrogenans]
MTGRDPLEGIPGELRDWHEGALAGDPAVCAAPQPMQPGFPCIWSKGFHNTHRDVYGRTWPNRPEEQLHVARKAAGVDSVVTVDTGDQGTVALTEPGWCTGGHEPVEYRADIEHQGPETPVGIETPCHGTVLTLGASIAQRPYSPTGAGVHALIRVGEEWHELSSAGLDRAAAALVEHATALRHLARQLSVLEVTR